MERRESVVEEEVTCTFSLLKSLTYAKDDMLKGRVSFRLRRGDDTSELVLFSGQMSLESPSIATARIFRVYL